MPEVTAAPQRTLSGARHELMDMLLGRFLAEQGDDWQDALGKVVQHEGPGGSTWTVYVALRGSPHLVLTATVVNAQPREQQTVQPPHPRPASARAPPRACGPQRRQTSPRPEPFARPKP